MKEYYMNIALIEAKKAQKKGEIPVGVVIVLNNEIISKSHNNRQKKYNVLGHAEINAILKAEKKIKDWRLDACEMYVTMYPCKMCEMIINESRIKKIYYLIENHSNQNITNNKTEQIKINELEVENYKQIIKTFFQKIRK